MTDKKSDVIVNPWHGLRKFTNARIAQGRSGVSLPTVPQLAFQLAHARARDAVHLELDTASLAQTLTSAFSNGLSCIELTTAAADRNTYLQRPDLGRRLDEASRARLQALHESDGFDVAFVIADGLSALAIEANAVAFLRALHQKLAPDEWSIAPIALVRQGRVAIGDEVGELLNAKLVVVLIGERPGLSSPDSMGLYLTWAPCVGMTDAGRNCISNVRSAGLGHDEAAVKLFYLMTESRRRRLSGVTLKEETVAEIEKVAGPERNFLIDGPLRPISAISGAAK